MSEFPTSASAPDAGRLIIRLGAEEPVSAIEVARVLNALARDYKRATKGSTLVVVSVRQGSIIADLTDAILAAAPKLKNAAEIAGAVKSVADFGNTVVNWLTKGKEKEKDSTLFMPGRKEIGQTSAEAIFTAAMNTGGVVEFKETGPDGYIIEVKVTPMEAYQAKEHAQARIGYVPGDRNLLPRSEAPLLLGSPEQMTERLRQIHLSSADGELSSEALELVALFVSLLVERGETYLIEELLQRLDVAGLHEIAEAVRSARRPDDPLLLPA